MAKGRIGGWWLLIACCIAILGALGAAGRRGADAPEIPGVSYALLQRTQPRTLRIHHLEVDLNRCDLEIAAVIAADPDGEGPAEAVLTPPALLAAGDGTVAFVNATPWRSLPDAEGNRSSVWVPGLPVDVIGLAATGGKPRSLASRSRCAVWTDPEGRVHVGTPRRGDEIVEGVGGFGMLVNDGRIVQPRDRPQHPRTAVGVDEGGRRLHLVVVDGRQPGYSEGMTCRELAELMLELGCYDAGNLDGGGSSLMMLRASDGRMRVVNSPSDRVYGIPVARAIPVGLAVRRKAAEDEDGDAGT